MRNWKYWKWVNRLAEKSCIHRELKIKEQSAYKEIRELKKQVDEIKTFSDFVQNRGLYEIKIHAADRQIRFTFCCSEQLFLEGMFCGNKEGAMDWLARDIGKRIIHEMRGKVILK